MAWSRWSKFITDDLGNIKPGTPVKVYTSSDTVAVIKGSKDGLTPKANPFNSDSFGLAAFYAEGGVYRIVLNEGLSTQREFPDEMIGSAQGFDVEELSGDVIYSGVASGVRVTFSTTITAGDPGPGNWRVNNLTFGSITQIRVDDLAIGGGSIAAWLDGLDDRATTNGRGVLRVENLTDPAQWAEFLLTGSVVNSSGYRTLTVTPRSQVGWPFTDGVSTAMTYSFTGNPGADGRDPGVLLTWETSTVDGNPAAGAMRANNASLASATLLFISKTGRFGANLATFLASLDDSTNPATKGTLILTDASTNAQAIWAVTGVVTDATGYVKLAVTASSFSGVTSFTNLNAISFQFIRAGDKGDAGDVTTAANFAAANKLVKTGTAGTKGVVASGIDIAADNALSGMDRFTYTRANDATGVDLNTLFTSGLYTSTGIINGPPGDATSHWYVQVNRYFANANSCEQWASRLTTGGSPAIYYRRFVVGAWDTWRRVDNWGKQTIWVPAVAMKPSPGTATFLDVAIGGAYYPVLTCDPSVAEYAFFQVGMPKNWDEGSISFVPYWFHPATTVNFGVVWNMAALSVGDGDALINGHTSGSSTDVGGTTNTLYVGPESAAFNPSNTEVENDMLHFYINRNPTHASDTMAVDAYLLGMKILYGVNTGTDD